MKLPENVREALQSGLRVLERTPDGCIARLESNDERCERIALLAMREAAEECVRIASQRTQDMPNYNEWWSGMAKGRESAYHDIRAYAASLSAGEGE